MNRGSGWLSLVPLVLVPVLALVMVGVAGASPSASAASQRLTADQLTAGASHACVPAGGRAPTVDWSALHDPVLAATAGGVKDEAAVWAGGHWHLLFSYVSYDPSGPGGIRWDIAAATSTDMVHWSAVDPWPPQPGVSGVASPDIVRQPSGTYLVTYQSDPGALPPSSENSRLYYRTSADLRHWSAPRALAHSLAPAPTDRMIDGALVYTGHQLLLGFKYSSPSQPDVFEVARSASGGPQGPWTVVGRPDITVEGGTVENYEFVRVAGLWRLMATSNNLDQPWLFTLSGNPDRARGWLSWSPGRQLDIPRAAVRHRLGPVQRRLRARQLGIPLRRRWTARSLRLPVLRRKRRADPVRRLGPRRNRRGPQHGSGPLAGSPGLRTAARR